MTSGSYKGAGIDVPDLLLYGTLAVSAYFIYKMVVKPTSDVTGAVGGAVSSTSDAYQNLVKTETNTIKNVTESYSNLLTGTSDNILKVENKIGDSIVGNKNGSNNQYGFNEVAYDKSIKGPYTKTTYVGTYNPGPSLKSTSNLQPGFNASNNTFTTISMANLNNAAKNVAAISQLKGPVKF